MRVKLTLRTVIFSLAIIFLSFEVVSLHQKVIHMRKSFRQRLKKYKKRELVNLFILNKALVNRFTFPKELKDIPFADENLVLGTKTIEIRNVFAPYNPALIKNDNGYTMFFRYDKIRQMYCGSVNTYIGCAKLDKNFEQTKEEFTTINTGSEFAEDPRVIQSANNTYLVYNDLIGKSKRAMHVAHLEPTTCEIQSIIPLDLRINQIEKNWSPFTYCGKNQEESLYFQYLVAAPRKILKFENKQSSFELEKSYARGEVWSPRWGTPYGGTPAHLVDGEYLSFFHSKFVDSMGIYWYVMGAYTFEAKPPFNITSVSPHPILFENIYGSTHLNTADPMKCVIFPTGFVIDEQNDKTVIHLACGENDSTCKIITLDKDQLLKSLKKVKH